MFVSLIWPFDGKPYATCFKWLILSSSILGYSISQKNSSCLVCLISNKTKKFSKIQRWGGLFMDHVSFVASSQHLFWKHTAVSTVCCEGPDTEKAVCFL